MCTCTLEMSPLQRTICSYVANMSISVVSAVRPQLDLSTQPLGLILFVWESACSISNSDALLWWDVLSVMLYTVFCSLVALVAVSSPQSPGWAYHQVHQSSSARKQGFLSGTVHPQWDSLHELRTACDASEHRHKFASRAISIIG